MTKKTAFVLSEDRQSEEPGLRLAIFSLQKNSPSCSVVVFCPEPSVGLQEWLAQFETVLLLQKRPDGATSWNCKPNALLAVLEMGFDEVVWFDSDAILVKPFEKITESMVPEEFLVATEPSSIPAQGSDFRTKGWGMTLGNAYPATANSCVLRATKLHVYLLKRWLELLSRPDYVAAQKVKLLSERPLHFQSDQDALNALLGSAECNEMKIRFLRLGSEIIHVGGSRNFAISERIGCVFGRKPTIVHLGGSKPWIAFDSKHGLRGSFWFYTRLVLETSPYLAFARKHSIAIGGNAAWINYTSKLGYVIRLLSFGQIGLAGWPITLLASVAAKTKRIIGRHRNV